MTACGATGGTLHLITGEYPPDLGGVAGYTAALARGLAAEGASVHVWCPGRARAPEPDGGVFVHRTLGAIGWRDLQRVDGELNTVAGPRRLIVQWVPHAFGHRSLNVPFCRWVSRRRRVYRDAVEVMVHEPFLPFSAAPRLAVAALVQRLMAMILLRAASRVWVSTPAWVPYLRPYTPSHAGEFTWVPIPATVPVTHDALARGREIRRSLVPAGGCVIGSFGLAGSFVEDTLAGAVLPVMGERHDTSLLLIGKGSIEAKVALVARDRQLADRIHASGPAQSDEVSRHLGACDLMVQPCLDGVCTRHSSVATVLAHGIPVVTTDGRFTESLWRETSGVALAPAGDTAALLRTVRQLVQDMDARQQLARRGRALYESRLHVRHTVRAIGAGVAAALP